ncbi:MAG: hypothetical protein ACOCRO_00810 [Halanaerobiales bacterium]
MLYYSNTMTGERFWFSSKENGDLFGIILLFNRMEWKPIKYKHKDIPDHLVRGFYEAESKSDYYNLIKTIFEKGKID